MRPGRAKKGSRASSGPILAGDLPRKSHAATIDENCAVALHVTAGQAHGGRQFESLYESLDPDNVLESAALDRIYDAV